MRRAGTTTAGRWLRLLLLVGTLLGLSAMHTLGHDAHPAAGHPADGRPVGHSTVGHSTSADRASVGHDTPVERPHRTSVVSPVMDRGDLTGPVRLAMVTARPLGCGAGCVVVLPYEPTGSPATGWSVCLAVLGALTVTLLVLLCAVRTRPAGVARPPSRPREPRAPPPRPLGLRLATVSVLRR
ncbi:MULTISPECIES: hypothetical protein [unclassified Micromonospora]|uniref:hypothetical protein n=1 Tax=unclassified Micromonospora TaxID=2617518 RepID=UPI0021032271|nr:hypothetical protein [Micromonospora sp. RL09-050-HVF-A]